MSSDRAPLDPSSGIEDLLATSPYEPLRRLGGGGMGEVYVARARSFGRLFALKVLRPHLGSSAELVSRMRLEAQAMGRLQHPHVVDVTDFWVAGNGRPCIVMELLSGRNLGEELRARRRLPPSEAIELLRQALDALAAAHALGMVHRDLKPENLYLHQLPPGFGRTLKVLDFGVVRLIEGSLDLAPLSFRTQTGALVGSPRFMSPEQARGEAVDHRTDIYTLGMVLYVMLAGRGPFDGGSSKAAPPSRHAAGVAPALDSIVLRALRPDRSERYQSAQEFLRDLSALGAAAR
jgi:eukaryotic-like serine/threonine-protein kinase